MLIVATHVRIAELFLGIGATLLSRRTSRRGDVDMAKETRERSRKGWPIPVHIVC